MTTPLTDRAASIPRDLAALAERRAADEEQVERQLPERRQALEREAKARRQKLEAQHKERRAELERRRNEILEAIASEARTERQFIDRTRDEAVRREEQRAEDDERSARSAAEGARWEAATIHEVAHRGAKSHRDEGQHALSALDREVAEIEEEAAGIFRSLGRRNLLERHVPAEPPPLPQGSPLAAMDGMVEEASQSASGLARHPLVAIARGKAWWAWGIAILAAGPIASLARHGSIVVDAPFWLGAGIAALLAAESFVVAGIIAARRAPGIARAIAAAKATSAAAAQEVVREEQGARARADAARDRELLRAEQELRTRLEEVHGRRDRELAQARRVHEYEGHASEEAARRRSESARGDFDRQLADLDDVARAAIKAQDTESARRLAEFDHDHAIRRQAMIDHWREGLARIEAEVDAINAWDRETFPDWSGPDWGRWAPASAPPAALRFGTIEIARSQIPHGTTEHPAMRAIGRPSYSIPALLDFPLGSSLFAWAHGPGRAEGTKLLRAVMTRLMTSVPPSKARLTLIDPVGLGESFAAFMHLADHDEQLVTSRVWTEPHHIEQRLADLAEHMENVIQKYLRNEFKDIAEYNRSAGEVAEPFRFLVIANFPAGFNESTIRRLFSIASSGPRCGVYVLMTIDSRLPLPAGIEFSELHGLGAHLMWKGDAFAWKHPSFGHWPLAIDSPPADDVATRALNAVGAIAKEAKKVQVPFEVIAPRESDYWAADTRSNVVVPLGRTGANKLQALRLGEGTSQHVLIAGKTGSGKSTLLHALIVNAALRYSPDQLQVYLIDFKKGVEFKSYAAHGLPHAAVVAIESEREFGLSVLQRLDDELRRRGDAFRAANVQDLAGFRSARPGEPTPRLLLIVDEFQEFFIEDDKLAQDASLYLDRLVRQGRAFGIHVHLGSQTLGGAYSLARSTLGQMAIRIALQCSESDAHLILSEDNTAARLLSRPGEAIYNDANGMIEGNNFFQVVWLPDENKDRYLEKIAAIGRDRGYRRPEPTIVFEGNIPAVLSRNHLLGRLLEADDWPPRSRSVSAWLGEAIAIKDPTAAIFRPQASANLLLVGQADESALAVLACALFSLAAQVPPRDGPTFVLLDGTPVDSPLAGYIGNLADAFPQRVRSGGWRDVPKLIGLVSEEVARRLAEPDAEHPPLFLAIYGIQNLRDLRKAEDDYSFSSRSDEETPPKQLANILREGSGVGVHVLAWCDSLNNFHRAFDRGGLREFDQRVLFQMSANDSSNLIDSPLANRLGPYRALLHSEDKGAPEKFRPYGLPSRDELARLAEPLLRRRRDAEIPVAPESEQADPAPGEDAATEAFP